MTNLSVRKSTNLTTKQGDVGYLWDFISSIKLARSHDTSKWGCDPQHIHPLQLEERKTSIFKTEVPSTSSCPEPWPPPSLPPSPKVKMVPIQLHDFSVLWWYGNNKHSVETILRSLNFNLFPGLVISRDAGQLPVSHTRGTDRHSYCILCFMFQIASWLQNNLWPRNSKSGYVSYGLEKPSHFQKRPGTQKYCCLVVCNSKQLETT